MQIQANRTRTRKPSSSMRAGIDDLFSAIPEKQEDAWLARGDVAAAVGFAWGETRAYAEAVEWLEKAIHATQGDCPVRAVEQCANFQVRLSGRDWQEMRMAVERDQAEADHPALIRAIELAIKELDLICQRAPTPERLSLLGSACKRLAWVHNEKAPRLKALVNMANYYRLAFDMGKSLGKEPDPYPFTNWATAKLLAVRLDPAQSGVWQTRLEGDCKQMIAVARSRNAEKPNFWDGVGEADCELVLLLALAKPTAREARTQAKHTAGLYRSAFQRGASPREIASVQEHMDFTIALSETAPKPVRNALAAIRAAL